jgi:outer membrane lipoprotein-sorting protein
MRKNIVLMKYILRLKATWYKYLYIFAIIAFFSVFQQSFAVDKSGVYEKIKSKYSDLNSIKLDFYDPISSVKGHITAAKNNKYKISLYDRIIISNGKTIWNYSQRDSNVLISSFDSFETELSVESLFFELLNNFSPSKMTDYNSSKGVSGYKLYLAPNKNYDNPHNILKIELVVDSQNYDLKEIAYKQDYTEYRWLISKIDINPATGENDFIFELKDNIEAIDLR